MFVYVGRSYAIEVDDSKSKIGRLGIVLVDCEVFPSRELSQELKIEVLDESYREERSLLGKIGWGIGAAYRILPIHSSVVAQKVPSLLEDDVLGDRGVHLHSETLVNTRRIGVFVGFGIEVVGEPSSLLNRFWEIAIKDIFYVLSEVDLNQGVKLLFFFIGSVATGVVGGKDRGDRKQFKIDIITSVSIDVSWRLDRLMLTFV